MTPPSLPLSTPHTPPAALHRAAVVSLALIIGGAAALGTATLSAAMVARGFPVAAVVLALVATVLAAAVMRLARRWTWRDVRAAAGEPHPVPRHTPAEAPLALTPPAPRPHRLASQLPQEREARSDLEVLERYLRDAREGMGVDALVFWREEPDGSVRPVAVSARDGAGVDFLDDAPRQALLAWAFRERLIVTNGDDRSLVLLGPVGKGERLHGVLGAHLRERDAAPREQLKRWLGRHASHLAALLELLGDARTARRYERRARQLLASVERILSNLDVDTLAREVCDTARSVTAADRAAFVLWRPEEACGQVYAATPGHPVPTGLTVGPESLVGRACRENQRFALGHVVHAGRAQTIFGAGEPARHVGSIGVVPVHRDRRMLGVITVEGDAPAQISAAETEALHLLATVVGVALEHALRYSQTWERAARDPLTGLWNRRTFQERLDQLLTESDRFGHPTSLILLDLDHFKAVNDSHGHDAGDAALRHVARVIGQEVRAVDCCARIGGEELAVLLPQTPLRRGCEVAERLRRALERQPVHVGGIVVPLTMSLGVAEYPENAAAHEGLFSAADRALYEAKAAGRNCVRAALVRTG